MNGSLWLWGALAVTVFWGVGVYNRLMRIQEQGLAALRSVEKHMQRCTKLIDLHANHIADNGAADNSSTAEISTASWAHLLDKARNLSQALKEVKGTHLASQAVVGVGLAFDATQDAWHQWCDGHLASENDPVPDAMRKQWDGATLRVQAAREGLNHILSKYNQAIAQFPARLLVKLFGFKPAGLM